MSSDQWQAQARAAMAAWARQLESVRAVDDSGVASDGSARVDIRVTLHSGAMLALEVHAKLPAQEHRDAWTSAYASAGVTAIWIASDPGQWQLDGSTLRQSGGGDSWPIMSMTLCDSGFALLPAAPTPFDTVHATNTPTTAATDSPTNAPTDTVTVAQESTPYYPPLPGVSSPSEGGSPRGFSGHTEAVTVGAGAAVMAALGTVSQPAPTASNPPVGLPVLEAVSVGSTTISHSREDEAMRARGHANGDTFCPYCDLPIYAGAPGVVRLGRHILCGPEGEEIVRGWTNTY